MVVVDDILLQRVGGRERVVREFAQAAGELQTALAERDLRIHVGGTHVLSNDLDARAAIVNIIARTRAVAVRHGRHLGVDCAAGRRIDRRVLKGEIQQAR
eukprot:1288584-Pyramimonas_sp.AAC.1